MGKRTSIGAAAVLTAACVMSIGEIAYGQQNPIDRVSNGGALEYSNVNVTPREMSPSFVRDGVVAEPQRFAAIAPGLEQAQVQALLGAPLRQQGREWEYSFKLKMEQSENFLVCQYKVVFDDGQRVRETIWRRRQCQQLASMRPPAQ